VGGTLLLAPRRSLRRFPFGRDVRHDLALAPARCRAQERERTDGFGLCGRDHGEGVASVRRNDRKFLADLAVPTSPVVSGPIRRRKAIGTVAAQGSACLVGRRCTSVRVSRRVCLIQCRGRSDHRDALRACPRRHYSSCLAQPTEPSASGRGPRFRPEGDEMVGDDEGRHRPPSRRSKAGDRSRVMYISALGAFSRRPPLAR